MKIGIVKEIKNKEGRVSLTPEGAHKLVEQGHEVVVEKNAGINSGFEDSEYIAAGARQVDVDEAWAVDLVVKVKEPLVAEYKYLKKQIVFTFFHLAGADPKLTEALLANGTTALAYETLEDLNGKLALLAPMSAVAGNMSVAMGNYYLARPNGGKGAHLGKLLGNKYGKVLVIGDGVVGLHAAQVAYGIGANVTVFGLRKEIKSDFVRSGLNDIQFKYSNRENIQCELYDADLVIGAVLLRGAKAPYVIDKDMVRSMQPGSVIVDVSIDQGGCIETSRPTTHTEPIFKQYGVTHYCVTNMPGAYPRTSTLALANATLPYIVKLANQGMEAYLKDAGLKKAINVYKQNINCLAVAQSLKMEENFKEI